ncbi:hypothetical protein GCM10009749_25360 [Agromyces neolithicus]|uniref:DUF222 domain-containing protein n=1 Tax=Agromyces neolithicus TaxID=269420 RepID=A0ABP4YMJ1_9MICO
MATPGSDGLTVTGGDESPAPIVGGVFADDADALAAAIATLEGYFELERQIRLSNDPTHGDLSEFLSPALESQVRAMLATAAQDADARVQATLVENARLQKRSEQGTRAMLAVAYCHVETDAIRALSGDEDTTEVIVSLMSTPDDPRRLRIDGMLPWQGEPLC